jgi:hypothetical protein
MSLRKSLVKPRSGGNVASGGLSGNQIYQGLGLLPSGQSSLGSNTGNMETHNSTSNNRRTPPLVLPSRKLSGQGFKLGASGVAQVTHVSANNRDQSPLAPYESRDSNLRKGSPFENRRVINKNEYFTQKREAATGILAAYGQNRSLASSKPFVQPPSGILNGLIGDHGRNVINDSGYENRRKSLK